MYFSCLHTQFSNIWLELRKTLALSLSLFFPLCTTVIGNRST